MSQQPFDEQAAIGQAKALSHLPKDLAVIKIEHDQAAMMSKAEPRDLQMIQRELTNQFDAFPELAGEMVYEKPVGKDDDGVEKFATGLSIRAAETVMAVYRYTNIETDVEELPSGNAKVTATFVDLQTGSIKKMNRIVSRFYKARGGAKVEHKPDRFWDIVVPNKTSLALREAILRSIPAGLKKWIWDQANARIDTQLDGEGIQKLIAAFAGIGVAAGDLEKYLDGKSLAKLEQEDRRRLLSVWNAIDQEEVTVAEAFGVTGDNTQKNTASALNPEAAAEAEMKETLKGMITSWNERHPENKIPPRKASGKITAAMKKDEPVAFINDWFDELNEELKPEDEAGSQEGDGQTTITSEVVDETDQQEPPAEKDTAPSAKPSGKPGGQAATATAASAEDTQAAADDSGTPDDGLF